MDTQRIQQPEVPVPSSSTVTTQVLKPAQDNAPKPVETAGANPTKAGENSQPADTSPEDVFTKKKKEEDLLISREKLAQVLKESGSHFQVDGVQDAIVRMKAMKATLGEEKKVQKVLSSVKGYHKALHTEPNSPQKRKKIEPVHLTLMDIDAAKTRMEDMRGELQWEKIEKAAGTENSPYFKTYFMASNVPMKEMVEALKLARGLREGKAEQIVQGNHVTPLKRELIWATKMWLLDQAIANPIKNGKPVEIDMEYYELTSPQLIEKARNAAKAGAKVRILFDAGRLRADANSTKDASELARRLQSLLFLMEGMEGKDLGVTLFANKKVLGARDELMHVKLFRVGDSVIFGGMNGNTDSGENVDFASVVRGPAATALVESLKQDVDLSREASVEEIYGSQLDELKENDNMVISNFGALSFLGAILYKKVNPLNYKSRQSYVDALLKAAEEQAAENGKHLTDYAEFPDLNGDGKVNDDDVKVFLMDENRQMVPITKEGRELLAEEIKAVVERTRDRKNADALGDITPPSEGTKGNDTMIIAGTPAERQALVLHAIDTAEKFIKISSFVLTEPLARVLIQKYNEMKKQGKEFTVQVTLDPGLYEYGGSPNEAGFAPLENSGIPVKWVLLDRSNPYHDRKNHSKLMITDKMLISGSTNFSTKGLRRNWEESAALLFDEKSPESLRIRDTAVADFDHLFNSESVGINLQKASDIQFEGVTSKDLPLRIKEFQAYLLRNLIGKIEQYEIQVGKKVQEAISPPDVEKKVEELEAKGISRGYAIFMTLGEEKLQQIRESTPQWKELHENFMLKNGHKIEPALLKSTDPQLDDFYLAV